MSIILTAAFPQRNQASSTAIESAQLGPQALPDAQICEQARLSRDSRFDGRFFTGVVSTRIYCRPVCPARWAKRVVYFNSAAGAEAAGFRPCLRCRPELSPGHGAWRRGDEAVARALKLIEQGALDEQPLGALAARVGIGERQLRRLFVERLGAPPVAVRSTRRLLFAKQLLTETSLPITQVAMAAGFGSLRRFNTVFSDSYRMAPSKLRRHPRALGDDTLTLRLGFRPPFDLAATLDFLRDRALPGLEVVDEHGYARLIAPDPTDRRSEPAWLRISPWPKGEHAVKLEVRGAAPTRLLGIVDRLRRMLDLDADPQAIVQALSASDLLRPLVQRRPGLRLPGGWDGFEIAVRGILGQHVSVAAGRTMGTRLTQHFGTQLPAPLAPDLEWLFPTPAALADADLVSIGLTRSRAHTIRVMSRALLDGRVDFKPERTLEGFVTRWTRLPGIGPWTANYLALRVLGHPDAFPADDLVLRRAASQGEPRITASKLLYRSEAWRPWRAYAAIQLWRHAKTVSTVAWKAIHLRREESQQTGGSI